MSEFQSINSLVRRFKELGAKRVFFKALSENDNSKQQIYLGSSFEVLTLFSYGDVLSDQDLDEPTFKATLNFWWVTPEHASPAPHAKLILYPRYPEVRLSGFLLGARIAPRAHLQPIPKAERRGIDGRVLFFGTTTDGRTLAALAPASSPLAREALQRRDAAGSDLLIELPLPTTVAGNSKIALIDALQGIQAMGFVASMRLKNGQCIPYSARNGAGYTLEALLGIEPNAKAEPDYLGWEIKTFGSNRITLMTPEPDGGFYGDRGASEFVMRYGSYDPSKDRSYFTGSHHFEKPHRKTNLTLHLEGYNAPTSTITNVNGSIQLIDGGGQLAASWSFSSLLSHWNRKHAFAAYIPYIADKESNKYRYIEPIMLGEHTDFIRYLSAIAAGLVYFDPGSKVDNLATKPRVKARSQFRIHPKNLGSLYQFFEKV